jgi:hypothetical protein
MPNIARLTTLIECLEALPPENKFDLANYAEVNPACGTSACACGYGALYPVLMEQGFRLYSRENYRDPIASIEEFNSFAARGVFRTGFNINFEGAWGNRAATKFFEIEWEQFCHMFLNQTYGDNRNPSPADVVRHIRDVIEGRV